jgi:hypothetical protein
VGDLPGFSADPCGPPVAVASADVLAFITAQRTGAGAVGLHVVDRFRGVSTPMSVNALVVGGSSLLPRRRRGDRPTHRRWDQAI